MENPANPLSRDGEDRAGAFFHDRLSAFRSFLTKDLFFIGGVPKSGTTWLRVMLDAHPEIACGGEGHLANEFGRLFQDAIRRYNEAIAARNRSFPNAVSPFPLFDRDDFHVLFASAAARLMMRIEGAGAARVLGEKTPDNIANFEFLAAVFPHAKFLHIVRDGRDCTISAWFHNLRINEVDARKYYPTLDSFVPSCAQAWARAVEDAITFCARHPGRCLTLRYEDLISQPRETLGTALEFLRVDSGPAVVGRCLAASAFESMSGGRPPGEEDRTSFMRRGQMGDWRNHFTAEMNDAFLRVGATAMAQFGYAVPSGNAPR